MKIYVLVYVHYEHYRLQENFFTHTDKQKVLDFAKNHKKDLPIEEYVDEPDLFWDAEIQHWWIEEFNIE